MAFASLSTVGSKLYTLIRWITWASVRAVQSRRSKSALASCWTCSQPRIPRGPTVSYSKQQRLENTEAITSNS